MIDTFAILFVNAAIVLVLFQAVKADRSGLWFKSSPPPKSGDARQAQPARPPRPFEPSRSLR